MNHSAYALSLCVYMLSVTQKRLWKNIWKRLQGVEYLYGMETLVPEHMVASETKKYKIEMDENQSDAEGTGKWISGLY